MLTLPAAVEENERSISCVGLEVTLGFQLFESGKSNLETPVDPSKEDAAALIAAAPRDELGAIETRR
jgi:hypothetical protein